MSILFVAVEAGHGELLAGRLSGVLRLAVWWAVEEGAGHSCSHLSVSLHLVYLLRQKKNIYRKLK